MFFQLVVLKKKLLLYVKRFFSIVFNIFSVLFFYFKAKRANVHTVILPFENQKDYNDLQDFIKDGLTVHFAKTYDDVYKIIFDEN